MAEALTGRYRYRTNWRGKLILQVEYTLNHCNDLNGSGHYDEWQTQNWRDAKVTDVPLNFLARTTT